MDKPINLLMIDFKKDITNMINSEEYKFIPILIKKMLLDEVKYQVDLTLQEVLLEEKNVYEKSLEKKEE